MQQTICPNFLDYITENDRIGHWTSGNSKCFNIWGSLHAFLFGHFGVFVLSIINIFLFVLLLIHWLLKLLLYLYITQSVNNIRIFVLVKEIFSIPFKFRNTRFRSKKLWYRHHDTNKQKLAAVKRGSSVLPLIT